MPFVAALRDCMRAQSPNCPIVPVSEPQETCILSTLELESAGNPPQDIDCSVLPVMACERSALLRLGTAGKELHPLETGPRQGMLENIGLLEDAMAKPDVIGHVTARDGDGSAPEEQPRSQSPPLLRRC